MSTIHQRVPQPISVRPPLLNGRTCMSGVDAPSSIEAALKSWRYGPWGGRQNLYMSAEQSTTGGQPNPSCEPRSAASASLELGPGPACDVQSAGAKRNGTITFRAQPLFSPPFRHPEFRTLDQVQIESKVTLSDMPVDVHRVRASPKSKNITAENVLATVAKSGSSRLLQGAWPVKTDMPYTIHYTNETVSETRQAQVTTTFTIVPFEQEKRQQPTWREALVSQLREDGTGFANEAHSTSDSHCTKLMIQRRPGWRRYGDSQPCTVSIVPPSAPVDGQETRACDLAARLLLSDDPVLDRAMSPGINRLCFAC